MTKPTLLFLILILPFITTAQRLDIGVNGGGILALPYKQNGIRISNGGNGTDYAAAAGISFYHNSMETGVGFEHFNYTLNQPYGNSGYNCSRPFVFIHWKTSAARTNAYVGIKLSSDNITVTNEAYGQFPASTNKYHYIDVGFPIGYTYVFGKHFGINIESDPGWYNTFCIALSLGLRITS